jgi:hypothetical protein
MSLCINPKETNINVEVNGGYIVLTVRSATVDETRRIRKAGGTPEMKRNKLEWKDESNEVIIKIMDDILLRCSALDEHGLPTELTYANGDGTEHTLDSEVEGWKNEISETIKLAAGREFFAVNAEIGDELIKN